MDENIMETEENDVIEAEDDVEELESEESERKKEGSATDAVSMQAALCMIIAISLIVLNIFKPEMAEPLFSELCRLSESAEKTMQNPIDFISAYFVK